MLTFLGYFESDVLQSRGCECVDFVRSNRNAASRQVARLEAQNEDNCSAVSDGGRRFFEGVGSRPMLILLLRRNNRPPREGKRWMVQAPNVHRGA